MANDSSVAGKLLVVDDDPAFFALVEQAAQATGIACVSARTAEDALRLTQDQPPLAVVIDGLLPGMRGDELAMRLRRLYPKDKLPILFISAFFRDMKSRTRLLKACQVDEVLHKPLSVADLERALSRYEALRSTSLAPPFQETPTDEIEVEISSEGLLPEYLALCHEQLQAMREALAGLGTQEMAKHLETLKTHAHRLRGSGASYGLPAISRLGARVEDLVDGLKGPPSATARAQLTGLVDAIAGKVARAAAQLPIDTARPEQRRLAIVLVDAAGRLSDSIQELRQPAVRAFDEVAAAVEDAQANPPDLVVVAGDVPRWDALEVAEQFDAGAHPVVVMGGEGSLERRLQAEARHVAGLVHRVPDAAALLRLAEEFAAARLDARVLAVDSDRVVLGAIAEALGPFRIDVEPCTEVSAFSRALEYVAPSFVIVSDTLKDTDGLTLVRVLRQDFRYRRVPVLVLQSRAGEAERLKALRAGADDVIAKPLNPEELAVRVKNHVGRFLQDERDAYVDPLTGTLRPRALVSAVRHALELARRGRSLAVLAFELDVERVTTEKGRLAADALVAGVGSRLINSFRASDVVGRLGPGRFAVLLNDVVQEDAERLLQANLEALEAVAREHGATLKPKGALASFPQLSADAEGLIAHAERGLTAR